MEVIRGEVRAPIGTKEISNLISNIDNCDCPRTVHCESCNFPLNLGGGEHRTCRMCGATGKACQDARRKTPTSPLVALGGIVSGDRKGVLLAQEISEPIKFTEFRGDHRLGTLLSNYQRGFKYTKAKAYPIETERK